MDLLLGLFLSVVDLVWWTNLALAVWFIFRGSKGILEDANRILSWIGERYSRAFMVARAHPHPIKEIRYSMGCPHPTWRKLYVANQRGRSEPVATQMCCRSCTHCEPITNQNKNWDVLPPIIVEPDELRPLIRKEAK